MIEKACHLLSQLPSTAPDILDALPFKTVYLHKYGLQSAEAGAMNFNSKVDIWKQLRVVHYVDNHILRWALHAAVGELHDRHGIAEGEKLADRILLFLQLSLKMSAEEGMHDTRWLIVCAFLWTSWQRSSMILLWCSLGSQLCGFSYKADSFNSLNRMGINIIPEISISRSQRSLEELRCTPYLCGWAYQSLLNDRANIAMDLRYFHELYHAHFGERPSVCNRNPTPTQCDGNASHNCERFKSKGARNQSMHDYKCTGSCQRLFWSRESFISISGAKAVNIVTTDSNNLRYCEVSKSTLTISHVWNHGQGGRPDKMGPEATGFNPCLHRRYATLATALGCESYWMDTPCIPSERELRRECIAQVNKIYATSGKTVICDRDLMTFNISNPTIHTYESILATLLVCDWSIRAWTLLEAMRGRHGLFVLCRHNKLINLHEILKSVRNDGRMDLVNLFLARDYLFPPEDVSDMELFGQPLWTTEDLEIEKGFVSIGEAAALLSHRHATRDGDDLLIWGLLIGDIQDDSPISMWKRQVGKSIPTGSLVSSAQRIRGHPGLGWAPFSPTALQRVDGQSISSKVYPAYDGCDSRDGLITLEGLRAKWLVYIFANGLASSVDNRESLDPAIPGMLLDYAAEHLLGYRWVALLQPMPRRGPRDIPLPYRGSLGRLVVVCGSVDQAAWEWKGIYEWDINIALPLFTMQDILLV